MSNCNTFFITGTDTGIGKTWTTLALMHAMQSAGFSVSGMKPVATGVMSSSDPPLNEDASLIQSQCSQPWDYGTINPYLLPTPVAPNFAASIANQKISLDTIVRNIRLLEASSEYLFIEGVGGWRVPWGDGLEACHLVSRLKLSVIMVVGLRLGCINHALMTAETMRHDGVKMNGWIANHVDSEYLHSNKTIEYLSTSLSAPLLGELPWLDDLDLNMLAGKLMMGPLKTKSLAASH